MSLGISGLLRFLGFNPYADLNKAISSNFENCSTAQDNKLVILKGPLKSTGLGHLGAVGELTEEIFVSSDE